MGRIFIFFSTDNGHSKFIFNMENLKKMNLDKFDLAILKVLQQNARASLNDIGAAVGLSSTPCWNRIKRMESAGVIRGYTVDIDPASLGFMDTVIVHVTLESHSEETLYEFGRALAQIPEVLEAFLVSGDYDYYIRIAVRDTRDYERLLREQLYRIPGIRHSKSCFVLRRLKDDAAADGRGERAKRNQRHVNSPDARTPHTTAAVTIRGTRVPAVRYQCPRCATKPELLRQSGAGHFLKCCPGAHGFLKKALPCKTLTGERFGVGVQGGSEFSRNHGKTSHSGQL